MNVEGDVIDSYVIPQDAVQTKVATLKAPAVELPPVKVEPILEEMANETSDKVKKQG
jgi:hypothetical protein